jgi:hypothetical protein
MSESGTTRNPSQVVIGLAILGVALLFLLDNMNVLHFEDFSDYWPLALVAVGVAQIVEARTWSKYAGAMAWMLVGVWLLGRNLGIIRVSIFHFWPLLLAGVGALLVFRGWRGYDAQFHGWRLGVDPPGGGAPGPASSSSEGWVTQPAAPDRPLFPRVDPVPPRPMPSPPASAFSGWSRSHQSGEDIVNAFAVLGGFRRRLTTSNFKGGVVIAFMGGATLDLREASMAQDEAVLDVVAVWGGIEMKVPDDWVVVSQVFPLMGGFEDRTGPMTSGARKRLVIRGLALMGGVEVKN